MKYALIVVFSLFLGGCAIVQGKSSPNQYASDAAATTQIKSKLVGSDIVSAPNIHVETQNGIVQLSGFVSNYAQVREAEQLARSVQGVKGVVNDLVISPKSRYRK